MINALSMGVISYALTHFMLYLWVLLDLYWLRSNSFYVLSMGVIGYSLTIGHFGYFHLHDMATLHKIGRKNALTIERKWRP